MSWDVVVVAVHLDHRGPDDVGEDALVRPGRIRLVVAEDGRDVVVAGQQPAVVDGVVEQRLVVAERLPDRERVVEVRLGVQVIGLDRHALDLRTWSGGVAGEETPATPPWESGNLSGVAQPAPGRPAFITGSSRAPLALDPNDAGFLRPTRS